jgi:hypothetical protein
MVVSTENITQNIYMGKEKSMQISNTLFRVGGAAILLSNRGRDAARAKFKLEHTVRTHLGSDDEAYHCVEQVTTICFVLSICRYTTHVLMYSACTIYRILMQKDW